MEEDKPIEERKGDGGNKPAEFGANAGALPADTGETIAGEADDKTPSAPEIVEDLPSWLDESRPTPMILTLIVLNTAIFLGMTMSALGQAAITNDGVYSLQSLIEILIAIPSYTLLCWGANANTVTILDHQYWRLISNTFLHQNLLHLGMNMYVLWDFNRLLERLYGSSKFITIYLVSGLGSSICSLLFLEPTNISAGASGAIFGIFGATVAFFWTFRKEFPKKLFRMYQKMFFVFLIYCVVSSQMFPGMDNAAHLGGFIVGLWTALCLLPSSVSSRTWAKGNFLKLSCLTLILVGGLELDIRSNRNNPQVQAELEIQRATNLEKHDLYESALYPLKKAQSITPQNPDIYAEEALAYSKLKLHRHAVEYASKALAIDPKNRKALATRSAEYHKVGLEKQAIEDHNSLLVLDPKAAKVYNNRAWSYNALNDPDKAIADSTRAIQLDPRFSASYDTRGVAYCLKQQYPQALEDFAHFIKINSKDGAVYYHRAYANLKLGKVDDARADLRLARQSNYHLEQWETDFLQEVLKL